MSLAAYASETDENLLREPNWQQCWKSASCKNKNSEKRILDQRRKFILNWSVINFSNTLHPAPFLITAFYNFRKRSMCPSLAVHVISYWNPDCTNILLRGAYSVPSSNMRGTWVIAQNIEPDIQCAAFIIFSYSLKDRSPFLMDGSDSIN